MTTSSPSLLRRSSNNMYTSVNLPDELIEEILSRCHVKSVVRFKSVSRSWQSIISHPRFSRTHRIQRSKLPENQNKFHIRVCRIGYISIRFEDGKFRIESEPLMLPYQSQDFIHTKCDCDGLFLLQTNYHYYTLWNPSIRKHAIIRPRVPGTGNPRCLHHHIYHDSITKDYKIVFVYEDCYTIYCCKNGSSCGEMKDFHRDIDIRNAQASLDGCFYSVRGGEIVCFDVRDENVRKIRRPGDVECEVQLKVVSGRMCLLGYRDDGCRRRRELWVMEKNYIGSSSSSSSSCFDKWCFCWRKLLRFDMDEADHLWFLTPIWLSNEDSVLLIDMKNCLRSSPKHMIYYNPCENRLRLVDFHCKFVPLCHTYSENLYMPCSNMLRAETAEPNPNSNGRFKRESKWPNKYKDFVM